MQWKIIVMIALGAIVGALARYALSEVLNSLHESVKVGTFVANVLGCFLIGLALGAVATNPEISPLWREFIITGFLGSLTTFSSFSGEVVQKLMQAKYLNAIGVVALHLIVGFIFTAIGFWLWKHFIHK